MSPSLQGRKPSTPDEFDVKGARSNSGVKARCCYEEDVGVFTSESRE